MRTSNIFRLKFWLDLDVWANMKLFFGRKETMSGRMGRMLKKGDKGCCYFRFVLCKILSWIDPTSDKHCIDSIKLDDEGNKI